MGNFWAKMGPKLPDNGRYPQLFGTVRAICIRKIVAELQQHYQHSASSENGTIGQTPSSAIWDQMLTLPQAKRAPALPLQCWVLPGCRTGPKQLLFWLPGGSCFCDRL